MRENAWTIVLQGIFPLRTSVWVAMWTVLPVMDLALMTVACVGTRRLSFTTGNVFLSVLTALTMRRRQQNAKVLLSFLIWIIYRTSFDFL